MKKFFANVWKFIKSLFTDIDWDGDPAKVFGAALMICGVVGFFFQKNDFQWLVMFGSGLIATGKFSKQG